MKNGMHVDEHGTKRWYRDGKYHRDDGPAVVYANGSERWYRDGELHRDDGPAVVYANAAKYWYRNGFIHRDDDGPAVVYANGDKVWYLNGKELSESEYKNSISASTKNEMSNMKPVAVSSAEFPKRTYLAREIPVHQAGSCFADHGGIEYVIISRGLSFTRGSVTYDANRVKVFGIHDLWTDEFALYAGAICDDITEQDLTPECDVYKTTLPYFGMVIVIEYWGNPGK